MHVFMRSWRRWLAARGVLAASLHRCDEQHTIIHTNNKAFDTTTSMRIETWMQIASELLWLIFSVDFLTRFFRVVARSPQVGKCEGGLFVPHQGLSPALRLRQ
jgi:hypothetical protein